MGQRRRAEGDPKDLPPVPAYAEGWALGKPDAVFEMQEPYKLPADGTIQYEYFYIPTNFTEAEVGEVDRSPPGQPRGRPPRARLLPRRRPTCSATPVMRAERRALADAAGPAEGGRAA